MVNATKPIDGATPIPSVPPETLSANLPKVQFLRAIRHFAASVKGMPTVRDAQNHFGPHFNSLAVSHCQTAMKAIRTALQTEKRGAEMEADLERLTRRLGRMPTASEIDNEISMAPAYRYVAHGKKLADGLPGKPVVPDLRPAPPPRGTLADESRFQPRVRDFFVPTADFGLGPAREDPREVRYRQVMESPLPQGVLVGDFRILIEPNPYSDSADSLVERSHGLGNGMSFDDASPVVHRVLHSLLRRKNLPQRDARPQVIHGVETPEKVPTTLPVSEDPGKVVLVHAPQIMIPVWNEFCEFVRQHAADLTNTPVVSALFMRGEVQAIRLLTEAKAKTQTKHYAQIWMRPSAPSKNKAMQTQEGGVVLGHWPSQVRGNMAGEAVMALFESMGFPVTELFERRVVMSGLRPSGEDRASDKLSWDDFINYHRQYASVLGDRFDRTYALFSGPDAKPATRFVTRFDWVDVDGKKIVDDITLEAVAPGVVKDVSSGGAIYWQKKNTRLVPDAIRGRSAMDVVVVWLSGMGVQLQSVERATVLGMLGSQLSPQGAAHRVLWGDVKTFLRGGRPALERLRLLYETMRGEKAPSVLVWSGHKATGDNAVVGSFNLTTEKEAAAGVGENAQYFKVRFSLTEDDIDFEVVGKGGKELKGILEGESPSAGGITLAPEVDEELTQSLQAQPENFGSTEAIYKPEPLITPADVLPVPQLTRPADAVDLPVAGGFQMTDPEAVRKFAIPPSYKIPSVVRPQETKMATVQHVYQRGFVKSGDSVAGGVAAVFDHYFAERESAYQSDTTAWGSAKASGLALGKVVVTLPFALGDAVHRIVSEVPKGPVPTAARAAQVFISGPFEGAANMGRGARHAWDSRGRMTAPRNAYVWTQLASQLALIVVGGAKAAKGGGGFMDGIGPDLLPVAAGDSMVAVATVSVPAVPAQVVAGALMMSALPPDFAKAAEGVTNGAKKGSLKPDEIVALWRFLIPQTPPRLSRQMVSAVLATLPHDAMGAVLAVVELTRRLVESKADGGLRVLMANTIEPQLSTAWKWGVSPELWQGMVSELSKGSPRNLLGVGHQFLKWVAYRRNDQAFQTAAPQIWQQLLDSIVAIEGPERIHMMGALGNKIQGRSGLTPAMKAAFEKASQSVR